MARTNDPKALEELRRKEKERLEQQREDLTRLLKTPEFRRYVWRHMNETCGLMRSAASPNGSTQSINIGMQDVGRAMWAEIEQTSPLAIPQMMSEYFKAQQQPEPEASEPPETT